MFLILQYNTMKNYCCLVTKSHPTLCYPINCCLPGSSVHVIFQERVLECVVISCSRGSSQLRDRTCIFYCISCYIFCISGRYFTAGPLEKLTMRSTVVPGKKKNTKKLAITVWGRQRRWEMVELKDHQKLNPC